MIFINPRHNPSIGSLRARPAYAERTGFLSSHFPSFRAQNPANSEREFRRGRHR
jgi:hypothetical protein